MTKLENVVINGNTLEVPAQAAVTYERINGFAKPGDVIVYGQQLYPGITAGVAYVVTEIDKYGDPWIIDDVGDDYDTGGDDFTVYRNVEKPEPEPQQAAYVEVNRQARAGERIRIVATVDCRWDNGEEFVVERVERGVNVLIKHPRGTFDGCAHVFRSEYVVLEPVEEKVTFNPGDKVRLLEGGGAYPLNGYENGRIYTVEIVNPHGDGDIRIKGGTVPYGYARPEQLVKVTEEEDVTAPKPVRIPVGSYVKITTDTENLPKGAIAKVTKDDGEGDRYPYRCELLDGSYYDWFRADQFEVITKEDAALYVEEAKWAAIGRNPGAYKAGDIVRIVRDQCGDPAGTITEVIDVSPSGIGHCVKAARRSRVMSWAADTDAIELVTPVERRFDKATAAQEVA